ncbi:hypothetical protein BDV98DRAFT_576908 [Pterulicium gracile]|uniref:F-box domain-containing protein n=1 Tax=Pterulicium gracile TaxID=1884261 RepID=A0A5C3Q6X4_9AGAR|nr:hypothetical protein BDV98DRAFT_576908 [Pterula gracilis]
MDANTIPSFPFTLPTSWQGTSWEHQGTLMTANSNVVTTSGSNCHSNSATSHPAHSVHDSVNSLPNEILADIFALVAGSYSSLETHNGLWKAILVCRRWKEVCESTPTLWATVSIDSHSACGFSPDSISRLIDTIMTRSYTCGLHLILRSLPDSIEPNFDHILNLLLAHSHRWETVDLLILGYVSSLKIPPNTLFPRLRSFTFATASQFNVCIPITHLITSHSPALRRLSLSGASLHLPCLEGDGLSEVEELTLNVSDWCAETVFSVLQAMPRLKSCTLVPCGMSAATLSTDRVPLSYLQSLELRTMDEALVKTYLQRLHCPSLRTVSSPCLASQNTSMSAIVSSLIST